MVSFDHNESKKAGGFKGEWLTLKFKNNAHITLETVSKDYEMLGGRDGGGCAGDLIYGRIVNYQMLKIRNAGEITTEDDGAKDYKQFLDKDSSHYIYESLEYYPQGTEVLMGACPGYTVAGAKLFSEKSKLNGVALDWYQYGTDCCKARPTEAEYQQFVKDKNFVLSAIEKAKLVQLVRSIQEL